MPSSQEENLVSIVIPTYRGDRFIATALSDIAAQTWANWEVIVVEDGSQGETERLVRSFAAQHCQRRVEYIRHPQNLSQSAARNTGMRAACGKWIALLDVDDRWLPPHLAASLAGLERENAELSYSTVVMFDDASELLCGIWGPKREDLAGFPFTLFTRSFITPSATVFRRDLIDRVGFFDAALCPVEDLDYWIRCAAAGVRFAHVKGGHVLYRKNHAGAETRGTCRLTETYARVIDKHQATLRNPPIELNRLAARAYFGAAWCHVTTRRDQDPTADPRRAPDLLRRAMELHRRKFKYWVHNALLHGCEVLRSEFLRDQYVRWFKPRKFMRMGSLPSPG